METGHSESNFHGKESIEYKNFKSKLPTIANGVESNLTSLANELLSAGIITTYEHSDAIKGSDSTLIRTTNLLRSVLTKIETDSSNSTANSCYMNFVCALRNSELQHIADQLLPTSRTTSAVGNRTSDSAVSITSGIGSLNLYGTNGGDDLASLGRPTSSCGSVLQPDDGKFPSGTQPQQKKSSIDGNSSSFQMEQSVNVIQSKKEQVTGYLPSVNPARYNSQSQFTSTNHTHEQHVCFGSHRPAAVPNSAPTFPSGDMFCDMCDIHEGEATHYKQVVTNRDDEKSSFHGLYDRCKTKCNQQMLEIKQLKMEKYILLKDVERRRQEHDVHIATLTQKLKETKDVCEQYKELVAKGAKEEKIDPKLLQSFEAVNYSST